MTRIFSDFVVTKLFFLTSTIAIASIPTIGNALSRDCAAIAAWGVQHLEIQGDTVRTSGGRIPKVFLAEGIEEAFGKPVQEWTEDEARALRDFIRSDCMTFTTDRKQPEAIRNERGYLLVSDMARNFRRYKDRIEVALAAEEAVKTLLAEIADLPADPSGLEGLRGISRQSNDLERVDKDRVATAVADKRANIVEQLIAKLETDLAALPSGYDGLVAVHRAYDRYAQETFRLVRGESELAGLIVFAKALEARTSPEVLDAFKENIQSKTTIAELEDEWGRLPLIAGMSANRTASGAEVPELEIVNVLIERGTEIETAETLARLNALPNDVSGLKQAVELYVDFTDRARTTPDVFSGLAEMASERVGSIATEIRREECPRVLEDVDLADNGELPTLLGDKIVSLNELVCIFKMAGVGSLDYRGPGWFRGGHTLTFTREDVETNARLELAEVSEGKEAFVPVSLKRAGEELEFTLQEWIDISSTLSTVAGFETCSTIKFSPYRSWKNDESVYWCFVRDPLFRLQ
jgi:hypothetical protein